MSVSKNKSKADESHLTSFYKTPKELIHTRLSFQLIPKIRENVTKIYANNKSIADECDINRILSDDWSVQRFADYYHNDVEEATQHLIATLKWRKSFGVNKRSLDKDIGKEFFTIGALFVYEEDKNGIPLLILRGKCNRKVTELRELIEMFIIGTIEQLDTRVGKTGFILVLDCSDCGLNNLSMDLMKFIITSLTVYYPLGIQYILVYNMPWLMRGIWKLIKVWLGEYRHFVHFANGDEITKYVDIESLPKYMGGKCSKLFTEAPDNCPTVYDLAEKYGFTQTEVRKYMKIYDDLLEEAKHY
ncbi:unnamed protein product [Medioppia subpectinata]|uniref:CRAL-TRIO domain-containing protein n=1 Tax=Medioppia subpectinata TaxID=1979941 RepID=A0A7R9KRJ1_9ACAR|nr:unnamed protein product [Medioppia subpectinata]CAG2108047.1 unnamed protein product [Medioppia subpectinata]